MVSASEIRDGASLRAWLEGRSDVDPVVFAARSAARVAPLVWARREASAGPGDQTTLYTCRALLTCGVVGQSATLPDSATSGATEAVAECSGEVRAEAKRAQFERESAGEAMDAVDAGADATARAKASRTYAEAVSAQTAINAAYHATLAAAAAASAAAPDARTASSYNAAARAAAAADYAASAAAPEEDRIWEQVREDAEALEAGEDISHRALWSISEPEFFSHASADFLSRWDADPDFTFWLSWWEGVRSGKQIDWALQERVARIPTDLWMQGPRGVAEEIAGLHRGDGSRQDRHEDPGVRAPSAMLGQNARAVRLQLDTLKVFVEGEIDRLKGPNDLTVQEHAARSVRLEMLAKIVEAVALMREAFEDAEPPASNALVVVEQQLPAVVENAQAAAEAGGDMAVSGAVISMAASIRHLTDAGTPGNAATAIAFGEFCLSKLKRLMAKR